MRRSPTWESGPAAAAMARMQAWSNTAPLGLPVVPLVQTMATGSVSTAGGRAVKGSSPVASASSARVRRVTPSSCVVGDDDLRRALLEDVGGLGHAEPGVHATRDRAEPDDGLVGDGVVDRRREPDAHDVAGAHTHRGQPGGHAVGGTGPLGEGDPPVTVDEGLDLAGLFDDGVEQLGQGAEVAGDGLLGHGHGGDTSNLTNRQTSAGPVAVRARAAADRKPGSRDRITAVLGSGTFLPQPGAHGRADGRDTWRRTCWSTAVVMVAGATGR